MAAKPQPVQNEPFEIVEEAIDQITGARSPQETQPFGSAQGHGQQGQPPSAKAAEGQAKPALEEKKKVAILTAHRRELDEITQLQKKRQEEMRARREPTKEQAQVQEQERQPQPLVEPTSKPKSGIFGGMLGSLRKKQRSVELPKTPTN